MVQLLLEQLEEECKEPNKRYMHFSIENKGGRNETPAYFGITQSHRRYATRSEISSRFAISMQYPQAVCIFYMTGIRRQNIHF
jgi:hypothetical protein